MKANSIRLMKTATRRMQIIHAALACFDLRGVAEATMAEIRQGSGASTGSIYHHFKSKEQLAASVYLEGIRDYQDGFLRVVKTQKRARQGVFAMVRYHLEWVHQKREWARFLLQQRHATFMGETDFEFQELNDRFMQGVSAWFRKQVMAGRIRRLPKDLYIALLLGPCQEYSRLYLSGTTCTALEESIRQIAGGAWRSLGAELAED